MIQTLTREEFKAAIEAGIAYAAEQRVPLRFADAQDLRAVGKTSTEAQIGTFGLDPDDCGCSLTQAGGFKRNKGVIWPGGQCFAHGFDLAVDHRAERVRVIG